MEEAIQVHSAEAETDEFQKPKKNHHLRNIEHLKALKEKNREKLLHLESEKEQLEQTRQRLAQVILKRAEKSRKLALERQLLEAQAPSELPEEPVKREPDAEEVKKQKLKAYFRSRYHSLLANIQENNKQKQQQKDKEERKRLKREVLLKEELGLSNVASKLLNPQKPPEDEPKTKKTTNVARKIYKNPPPLPEPDENAKQKAKEAAELIFKRAQQHLTELVNRKQEQAKREQDAKTRELKLKQALERSVLARAQTVERPRKEERRPASVSPKPPRKFDEKHLEKLAQVPKRFTGPLMTDMSVFKKKHKLDENTRVFIVSGGFRDITKALKQRSNSYLARLVREPREK